MTEADIKRTYPRDVLMHLLSTLTLYWSVFSLLSLLFTYINIWIKDPLERYAEPMSAINWPLAMLVILFPVYLWTVWFINRDLARNPEKNEFRIRRWLLYLNVFLSAVLIIGDMIALLYGFLNGDLSARFIWKVLAVFIVGAAIFAYYIFDLRRAPTDTGRLKFWRWGAVAAVILVAIGGIAIAGSPFAQRLMRFDAQKVGDLLGIQNQVVSYWQSKNALPPDLASLRDTISGYVPPKDPQSEADYEYRATGPLSFELCANFNYPSSEEKNSRSEYYYGAYPGGKNDTWEHDKGRSCFSRTIDPELYKLRPEIPTRPVPLP